MTTAPRSGDLSDLNPLVAIGGGLALAGVGLATALVARRRSSTP